MTERKSIKTVLALAAALSLAAAPAFAQGAASGTNEGGTTAPGTTTVVPGTGNGAAVMPYTTSPNAEAMSTPGATGTSGTGGQGSLGASPGNRALDSGVTGANS